jgi:hypothetical protein
MKRHLKRHQPPVIRGILGAVLGTCLSDVERMEIMRYAVLAAVADGRIERSEDRFLHHIEHHLGITAPEVRELEGLTHELFRALRHSKVTASKVHSLIERYVR